MRRPDAYFPLGGGEPARLRVVAERVVERVLLRLELPTLGYVGAVLHRALAPQDVDRVLVGRVADEQLAGLDQGVVVGVQALAVLLGVPVLGCFNVVLQFVN